MVSGRKEKGEGEMRKEEEKAGKAGMNERR